MDRKTFDELFPDDYFSRHRNKQEWSSIEKRKLDAKPKVEVPKEEPVEMPVEEEYVPSYDSGVDYFKAITAGLAGGFLVLAVLRLGLLELSIFSARFWLNTGILLIIIIFFVLLLKIPYNYFKR